MQTVNPLSKARLSEPISIWISPDILDWDHSNEGTVMPADTDLSEPYKQLDHVFHILSNNDSESYRVDAMVNLNRLIEVRLSQLEETYHFKKLKVFGTKTDRLAILENAGVIRAPLVMQINSIRNRVEHRRSSPPSKQKVEELSELAWYFLRATDYLLIELARPITFAHHDPAYDFSIAFNYDNWWEPTLAGWFPKDVFEFKRVERFIEIKASHLLSQERLVELTPAISAEEERDGGFIGRGRNPGDMMIEGVLLADTELHKWLVRMYLAAALGTPEPLSPLRK